MLKNNYIYSIKIKIFYIIKNILRILIYFKSKIKKSIILVCYYPIYLLHSRNKYNLSSIFIVGAPRTGSTILYQALTNCFDIRYIDNLSASWYKNLPFGIWLSNRFFKLTPHNNFDAEHGNTSKFGAHAPSECGQFWYRWLPGDKHFIDIGEIPRSTISRLKRELFKVKNLFNEPIIFKNLNMGQRLRFIKEFAPDSKIIFLQRDPHFTVKSILKARKNVGLAPNQIWSVKPKNYKDLEKLQEIEMCVAQVYYLEKQIKEDLTLFPSSNVRTVKYNDLSQDLVNQLANWLGLIPKRKSIFPQFRKDISAAIDEKKDRIIKTTIKKYKFDECNSN